MENIISNKYNMKGRKVVILISNRKDFKTKMVRRDKEGHYM
jgi:hypothetical protein